MRFQPIKERWELLIGCFWSESFDEKKKNKRENRESEREKEKAATTTTTITTQNDKKSYSICALFIYIYTNIISTIIYICMYLVALCVLMPCVRCEIRRWWTNAQKVETKNRRWQKEEKKSEFLIKKCC